ncbi:MAG: hypothetical protein DCC75_02785 [Proteobacteria bacterium]|nr:MAG: hypothetical protein DCC75_02785 [Pseudomonadota bacterium]
MTEIFLKAILFRMPSAPPPQDNHFAGQQADEQILYIIRPHLIMLAIRICQVLFLSGLAHLAWLRSGSILSRRFEIDQNIGYYAIWVVTAVALWWVWKYWRTLRAYITDRRIVRFEAVFPVTEKRRALFWREVTKTRGVASSVIWRLINIGAVEVSPLVAEYGGSIILPYAHYFEDLAAYMDKIIHATKFNPEQIKEIRPFVTKPKGQRYPLEGDATL